MAFYTIDGTNGPDTLIDYNRYPGDGYLGLVTINGFGGDDIIFGEDISTKYHIFGGAGNDFIVGGANKDILIGDDLSGGVGGNDYLVGGGGTVTISSMALVVTILSMGVLALINSLGMLALIALLGVPATIFSCFIQFQIVNLVCHEILSKTLLETVTYPVT